MKVPAATSTRTLSKTGSTPIMPGNKRTMLIAALAIAAVAGVVMYRIFKSRKSRAVPPEPVVQEDVRQWKPHPQPHYTPRGPPPVHPPIPAPPVVQPPRPTPPPAAAPAAPPAPTHGVHPGVSMSTRRDIQTPPADASTGMSTQMLPESTRVLPDEKPAPMPVGDKSPPSKTQSKPAPTGPTETVSDATPL